MPGLVSILPLALGLAAAPAPAPLEVAGARLHLGDLVPRAPQPWAQVDLGPAPAPLQRRTFAAAELARAIARAGLPALPDVPLPARQVVQRRGRGIHQIALREILERQVLAQLPVGTTLRQLNVARGLTVGTGELAVAIAWPDRPVNGRQTLMATLMTEDGWEGQLPVQVDLSRPRGELRAVVDRGQQVTIVLEGAGVRLESAGLAQSRGAVGDSIQVLPAVGSRVLRARVVDAHTVQVPL